MYLKIHHSAIDGATGNQIIEALHDLEPNSVIISDPDNWGGVRTNPALTHCSKMPI
jgi:hypothetical protein